MKFSFIQKNCYKIISSKKIVSKVDGVKIVTLSTKHYYIIIIIIEKHQWTLLVIDKGFQHTKLCLIWVYMQKL